MRIAPIVVCTLSTLTIGLVACSGDEVDVGRTNQQLTLRKDGTATGNGASCSWDGTTAYDAVNGTILTPPSYKLGSDFASLDGCNDCTCTAKGIMCTIRSCEGHGDGGPVPPPTSPTPTPISDAGPPHACPALRIDCPPGTTPADPDPYCGIFTKCVPSGGTGACPADAALCPDGKTYVTRTGPDCTFPACP